MLVTVCHVQKRYNLINLGVLNSNIKGGIQLNFFGVVHRNRNNFKRIIREHEGNEFFIDAQKEWIWRLSLLTIRVFKISFRNKLRLLGLLVESDEEAM